VQDGAVLIPELLWRVGRFGARGGPTNDYDLALICRSDKRSKAEQSGQAKVDVPGAPNNHAGRLALARSLQAAPGQVRGSGSHLDDWVTEEKRSLLHHWHPRHELRGHVSGHCNHGQAAVLDLA